MFKTGSAQMEPYAEDILREISSILNEVPIDCHYRAIRIPARSPAARRAIAIGSCLPIRPMRRGAP